MVNVDIGQASKVYTPKIQRLNSLYGGVVCYSLQISLSVEFVERKFNSAMDAQNIVHSVLLSFLETGGDGLFRQDNTCLHNIRVIQHYLKVA